MSTTRTKLLKTYLHADEEATILRACTAVGATRSDQTRTVMLHWAMEQRHVKRAPARHEGPSERRHRSQLPACRPSYGVVPKMHMRV